MRASYASDPDKSRGRQFDEVISTFRSPFQRDRDRIIHSSGFRRLKHKTQVFVEHEGDYYRTRLTHTIEVAQVARTISGALGLNQELAEAVALAHDLGHPPFGHTGEDALAVLMSPYGGFDHNAQAIRILTRLERHYADFDGLNLTWETLEGIAKHNGPVTGDVPYALAEFNDVYDLELDGYASAEAQVAAFSDDVAYNHHDLHDGLRAGLFDEADLMELPLTGPAFAEVDRLYPGLDTMRRRHEALRRVFGVMVEDVIAIAQTRLAAADPKSAEDIRALGKPMIRFSKKLYMEIKAIKAFL
ncbi:MAG: dNTP triphosphohydrolase, partial [Paracoccaceae bacterium]